MSALWTDMDAAKATGGMAVGAWAATGISIDTRTLQPGDLFVPLKDVRDGHDFIPMAFEKGAAAVISEHEIKDVPALVVDDALKALEDLGKAALARSKAKRIAVTGSVGKTTVKEMLASALRTSAKVHASEKSYNNHWGVPLTMAKLPQDADFAVFEMGMNHAGELSHLTNLVRPDIAIVTKVSEAHLEFFDSVEGIARAKAEIFEGLSKDGIGVFNVQSEFASIFRSVIPGRMVTFGQSPADCQSANIVKTQIGSVVDYELGTKTIRVSIPFHGDHWVDNAACVLLVSDLLGFNLKKISQSIENMRGIAGRGQRHDLILDGKSFTLIDESYNANPESMRSSIAALGAATTRKIAVLGDMLELGRDEVKLHAGLKPYLEAAGVDLVLTCGARMQALHDALGSDLRGLWAATADEAETLLKSALQSGDTVMIKGSNASGMGKLVGALLAQNKNKNKNKETANVL